MTRPSYVTVTVDATVHGGKLEPYELFAPYPLVILDSLAGRNHLANTGHDQREGQLCHGVPFRFVTNPGDDHARFRRRIQVDAVTTNPVPSQQL